MDGKQVASVPPRRRIKDKILFANLVLAVFVPVAFAAVALWEIGRMGGYAVEQNEELGKGALAISRQALETLAEKELLSIVTDRADFITAKLAAIEIASHVAAETVRSGYGKAAGRSEITCFPPTRRPADARKSPLCVEAPGSDASAAERNRQALSHFDAVASTLLGEAPEIANFQYGAVSGTFWRLPWSDELPRDYDPRQRDWYRAAMEKGDAGWTAPYVSAIEKRLRINCFHPVYAEGGRPLGVVGVVVHLDTLNEKIIKQRLTAGTPVLVTGDLQVIAREGFNSASQDWKSPLTAVHFKHDGPAAEIEGIKRALAAGASGVIKSRHENRDAFIAFASIPRLGWGYIVTLAVDDLHRPIVSPTERTIAAQTKKTTAHVTHSVRRSVALFCIVVVVLVIVVIQVSRVLAERIVGPVGDLTDGVKVIGGGDLDHRVDVRSGDEIEVLAGAFNAMAADLQDHIRSLTEATAARERIESELRVATSIQASLLPKVFPPFPNRPELDLYALMDPAKEVGGDFYDFFFIDPDRFCFVIADVSDKGVPAALLMMVAKSLIKMETMSGPALAEVIRRVNEFMSEDNENAMFVTTFACLLDVRTGELTCVNAGHNPPMLRTAGGAWEYLQVEPSMPIGAMPGMEYRGVGRTLAPGDTIVLYTDGVTEAKSVGGQLFGEDRLLDSIGRAGAGDVAHLVRAVRADVATHAAGAVQSDDITLLGLGYRGPA